jgi:hypothetical protein
MATWVVERTQDRRFPFRITIEQEGRTLLAVRAQNHWPGAGSQIFCLRETELDPAEPLEPYERVEVARENLLGNVHEIRGLHQQQRQELPDAFEFALLRGRFAEVPQVRLRRILNQLRAEGRLRCEGRGRAARWVRETALPGDLMERQVDPRFAPFGSQPARKSE